MKSPALVPILVSLSLFLGSLFVPTASAVPPSRETLQKAYDAGIAAFEREDLAAAEKSFVYVLQHVPGHAQSRRYLVQIEQKRKADANIPPMQKALTKLTIPEFKADEMSLEDALTLFKQKAKELSGGKIVPNFVFRPSGPEMTERQVTLSLTEVPMNELLRHIGLLTDTKYTFEQYAITVTPTRSTEVDAETAAALDAAAKRPEDK